MLHRITVPPVPPELLPASSPGPPTPSPAAAPVSDLAGRLADVLASVLGRPVPSDADVFTDLGADSMVMARFCARVRKDPDLPDLAMRDVYRHRSAASLAAAFGAAPAEPAEPSPIERSVPPPAPARVGGRVEHLLCGVLQLLVYVGYALVTAGVGVAAYQWVGAAADPVAIYLRSVAVGAALTTALVVVPILAKWLIIGRWQPAEIRIWSLGYFRFWLVKSLLRVNPLARFVGSPLFVLYLRALGAKVGREVTILTRTVPVCTDLFTVGDGTVVRKDVMIGGYRAHAGVIQTGPVTLGRDVVVGEASVLDIGTTMGDGAQLGHRSTLLSGQVVPAGERWHGSPARRAGVGTDFRGPRPRPVGSWRRVGFGIGELLTLLLVVEPIGIGLVLELLSIPRVGVLLGSAPPALDDWQLYAQAAAFAGLLVLGGVAGGMLLVVTVPRLLRLLITEGRTYPLYGFHHSVHRTIMRLTNSKLLTGYFGDSALITGYLRAIGYDLSHVEQTGSNFGSEVRHETPFLARVGTGTMVADGLSIANAEYSNSSFRLMPVAIGARNFLGNHVVYPAGARTGDNCLLATKVMVPVTGPVRRDTGLLGSPAFEIPRSVDRDGSWDDLPHAEVARRVRRKRAHNLRTLGLLFGSRWLALTFASLIGLAGLDLSDRFGVVAIAGAILVNLVVGVVFAAFGERASTRFGPMSPRFCSIWDSTFWRHERFWKMQANQRLLTMLNGTPFKPLVWRMLGVRIGRRVFDDGVNMPERLLVTIGSDATLNAGSILQCHSQEDGSFKSDHTSLGDRVTVGVGALVHYGVTVGDDVVIAADSFVMKGEDLPAGSLWGGNPARQVRAAQAVHAPTSQPVGVLPLPSHEKAHVS